MAARLLDLWNSDSRLVVVTGAFHTRIDVEGGGTMAMHLARELPQLRAATIDYASGRGWYKGSPFPLAPAASPEAIQLLVQSGSPAVVPAPTAAAQGDVS